MPISFHFSHRKPEYRVQIETSVFWISLFEVYQINQGTKILCQGNGCTAGAEVLAGVLWINEYPHETVPLQEHP